MERRALTARCHAVYPGMAMNATEDGAEMDSEVEPTAIAYYSDPQGIEDANTTLEALEEPVVTTEEEDDMTMVMTSLTLPSGETIEATTVEMGENSTTSALGAQSAG